MSKAETLKALDTYYSEIEKLEKDKADIEAKIEALTQEAEAAEIEFFKGRGKKIVDIDSSNPNKDSKDSEPKLSKADIAANVKKMIAVTPKTKGDGMDITAIFKEAGVAKHAEVKKQYLATEGLQTVGKARGMKYYLPK